MYIYFSLMNKSFSNKNYLSQLVLNMAFKGFIINLTKSLSNHRLNYIMVNFEDIQNTYSSQMQLFGKITKVAMQMQLIKPANKCSPKLWFSK